MSDVCSSDLPGLAHADIVEGLRVHVHADDAGLGGSDFGDAHKRDARGKLQRRNAETIDRVDLARRQRGDRRRVVLAGVDVADLVEIDLTAPVGLAAPAQRAALAHHELGELEGAGADRVLGEVAAVLLEVAMHERSEETTSEHTSLMRNSYD